MKKEKEKVMPIWEYYIRQNIEGWEIKKGGERIEWLISFVQNEKDKEYQRGLEDKLNEIREKAEEFIKADYKDYENYKEALEEFILASL